MKKRFAVLTAGCFVFAAILLGRASWIQIIGDERLEKMSKRQFGSSMLVRPRRGLILDRNGEPLAVNAEIQSLAANPSKIQNKKTLARLLSKTLDIPHQKLLDRLKGGKEFVWIKRHIPDQDIEKFKKWQIINPDGELIPGLWMVRESRRTWPHQELAAHVLGGVNLDSEGVEGVELLADEQLKGRVVSVSAVRDALGRPTFIDALAAKGAKDGESVTLTIDASLQFSVEQELKNAVLKANAKAGSVMVMDAVTGEILAMANEPSFDPNHKDTLANHRRNRVITDGYEPGSVLKPVLLSAALASGMKLTDSLWGERGSFVIQGKRISEAEAHEKFEWINLKKMIQVSSNVGAAKLALKVGADRFLGTLKAFGFGSKTGVDFPGEISGKIPARKSWQPLALANIGFGQGILVTPIQMIRAYAAFANGGWLVRPTLMKTPLGKHSVPDAPKRIMTQQVADGVVEALKSVTREEGSGIKAALEGYAVAGKTGTAQTVDPATGKYSRSRFIASFVGFAAGVEPKLVIFTSIDDPRGIYYASETAAPLFRAVLNATATRFSLPASSTPNILVVDHLKQTTAHAVHHAVQWTGSTEGGGPIWQMPALHGLTGREALRALKGHQFEVKIQGNGLVQTQTPEEGTAIVNGDSVRLQLAEPQ